MITLLVSSKTMVRKKGSFVADITEPIFTEEAKKLNEELAGMSNPQLKKLMHISDSLAEEVRRKVNSWSGEVPWPAWLLFSGDVYKGLEAETLDKEDFEWAQNKVWTLSGMYGIAKPLDGIKPYRLETGFKLRVGDKKNIYDFWGDKVAKMIPDKVVVNLSSEEYIKLIRKYYSGSIITPLFLQDRKTGVKFEAVHAKVARGAMARWIIKAKINDPIELKEFKEGGYIFDEQRSTELQPVFVRKSEGVMKIVKS